MAFLLDYSNPEKFDKILLGVFVDTTFGLNWHERFIACALFILSGFEFFRKLILIKNPELKEAWEYITNEQSIQSEYAPIEHSPAAGSDTSWQAGRAINRSGGRTNRRIKKATRARTANGIRSIDEFRNKQD